MTVSFARGLLTLTVSVTEPEPPAASAPIDQVTPLADSVPPPVADTNVVLPGTVSDSTTPVAPVFPLSLHDALPIFVPPAATGSGASVADTARTGADVTVVVMTTPLTGAVSVESMLYVPSVMTVPFARGLLTLTVSVTEPEPPAASAPIDQVTTPAESDPPPVAETNVVLAGTVSDSTTPVAPEFPVFDLPGALPIVPPAATGSGASVADTTRTGAEVTVAV